MSVTDQLVMNNRSVANMFSKGALSHRPAKAVAVVTCMDTRIDVHRMLAVEEGDLHVIRNAGGAVTDDVIRSLLISQRLLGTQEVMVVHHTDCGMTTFSEDGMKRQLEMETGIRPPFALEAFPDADRDVLQSVARIKASPFVLHKGSVRGFVYDVHNGLLREVTGP